MENITFWRYQIINKGTMETPFYGVHEVYIDEKTAKVIMWTEDPVALGNYEDIEELRSDLQKILSDIKKQPILLEPDLENDLER
ncbi:hypothetical protein SAMN05421786_10599 [Chryseobacterium ureilyticum]|uniref:Uncharacterized protein n=1 Tax=Chryseobacterium ureilyticum TaxID=373668 RepID=A0A1N7PE89_9FLAO|nr:hypothetical protein [Chryseobacterium ureilyticum]SIT08878.1 hypothetical protein SAMN05421786_10599 [Chryseobacterium ureilyticum]